MLPKVHRLLGSPRHYSIPSNSNGPCHHQSNPNKRSVFPCPFFSFCLLLLQVQKHSQSSAKQFLKTARSPYCFEQLGVSAWCKRVRPSNNNNNNNNTNPLLFWVGGISASSDPLQHSRDPWVPPFEAISGSEGLLRPGRTWKTGPMGLGRSRLWSHQARFCSLPNQSHALEVARWDCVDEKGRQYGTLCNHHPPACGTPVRLRFGSTRRARSRQKHAVHSSPSLLAVASRKQ